MTEEESTPPPPYREDIRMRGSDPKDEAKIKQMLQDHRKELEELRAWKKQKVEEDRQKEEQRQQEERNALFKQFTPTDQEKYKEFSNRELKAILRDRQKPGLEIPPSEEKKKMGRPVWDPIQGKNVWAEE